MESVFNINPSDLPKLQEYHLFEYTFLNNIIDVEYTKYYSLIQSLEKFKIKNLYNSLFLRSLRLKKKGVREMKLNKYIDSYEILNEELINYIQNEKLYAIIIMNGIQNFFLPLNSQ